MISTKIVSGSPEVYATLSRIYMSRCYLDSNGFPNPFDARYASGGGHFARTPEWFQANDTEGCRIMFLYEFEKVIGFALYYTTADFFPGFAADVLHFREISGMVLAYTYLFTLLPGYERRGYGRLLINRMRTDCWEQGCTALAHEVFVLPLVNAASVGFHQSLCEDIGAINTGTVGTHDLDRPSGRVRIQYAQYLIPTDDVRGFVVHSDGRIGLAA